MKKILFVLIISMYLSSAAEKCLFDAKGVCYTKFQNFQELNNLKDPPLKKYYIASYDTTSKGGKSLYIQPPSRMSKGKKRWYEVDWNQGVKLCPEKDFNSGKGIWIVNGSAHIDSKNCVFIEGSPYTRSILVLFSRNPNDLTEADSNWILVNQTIVELTGKNFQIWDGHPKTIYGKKNKESKIKEISLTQDLIVDKTELRVRDAIWLREGKVKTPLLDSRGYYPTADSSKLLDYPIISGEYVYLYQEWRSEKDGLENTFKKIPVNQIDTNKIRFRTQKNFNFVDVFDTSSNGYRMPTKDELKVLQSGGKTSTFFWGNDTSENIVQKYLNINCASTDLGVHPVKQYAPNPFGLYDVYGNAEELSMRYHTNNLFDEIENRVDYHYDCEGFDEINVDIGKMCELRQKYKCRTFRKPLFDGGTGFDGLRLVRKLE